MSDCEEQRPPALKRRILSDALTPAVKAGASTQNAWFHCFTPAGQQPSLAYWVKERPGRSFNASPSPRVQKQYLRTSA